MQPAAQLLGSTPPCPALSVCPWHVPPGAAQHGADGELPPGFAFGSRWQSRARSRLSAGRWGCPLGSLCGFGGCWYLPACADQETYDLMAQSGTRGTCRCSVLSLPRQRKTTPWRSWSPAFLRAPEPCSPREAGTAQPWPLPSTHGAAVPPAGSDPARTMLAAPTGASRFPGSAARCPGSAGRGGPGWRRCGAAGSIRASALSGAGEQRGQEAPSSSSGQVGGRGCGLSRREAAVFALTLPGGRRGGLSCSFLQQRHDKDLFLLKEI